VEGKEKGWKEGESKMKKLSYYKSRAWKMFSLYIRTRDCLLTTRRQDTGKCVTCGQVFHFKDLQAGHAIGGRNNSILFDEELVNAQCRSCNLFGGKYAEYSVWFINKYGLERWQEKVHLKKRSVVLKRDDYIAIFEEYKKKHEDLTT
jgi:hypothetical protein